MMVSATVISSTILQIIVLVQGKELKAAGNRGGQRGFFPVEKYSMNDGL